ncbi:MAG TPA: SPOR domain-containing protein [Albitalea sp.]|uniref:SPOR domain-containing protein n=1 Tax=Piscinibacter sp. TaxID=1903157 RepID=UPI002ED46BC8
MKFQRGGFVMGLIVGLMAGLAIALGVALYVTKVPVPFVNKVPQRTAEQDAAEAEKNRNWDPNSPLYGKNPARPGAMPPPPPASAVMPNAPAAAVPPPPDAVATAPKPAASAPRRDPGEILADRPGASTTTAAASPRSGPDPFSYFVQVGAFARPEDAEQQRARLAMLGFAARVTEREQAGRTVYRVRVGPYERKEDADSAKDKLDGSGMESSLVRVQRQ